MLAQLCAHPWSSSAQGRRGITNKNRSDNSDSKNSSESSEESSRRMNIKKGNGETQTKDRNKTKRSKFLLPKIKSLNLKSAEKSQPNQNFKRKPKNEDSCRCTQPDALNSMKQQKNQTLKPGKECMCKEFETFLNKSSIQEPGNIPMVVIRDVVLRATGAFNRKDIVLAMGNVVNGIHKTSDWIFVQTAQGNDGYIPYNSCLPLGIRPPTRKLSQLAPWEIDNQIIRSNQTDIQKLCEFSDEQELERKNCVITVVCGYISKNDKQLSVRRGENVEMIRKKDDDWLQVKTIDDREGLIPLAYTSVGKQHFF